MSLDLHPHVKARMERLADNYEALDRAGRCNLVGLSEMHLMASHIIPGATEKPCEPRILGNMATTSSAPTEELWDESSLIFYTLQTAWGRQTKEDSEDAALLDYFRREVNN